MTDFTSDALTASVSDLSKRVRYSTGLVLGVDEFEQDQAYFIERDRLLTRALHGYGVVQGLGVYLDPSEDRAQVRVEPGLAVEPSGQHVCVDREQCAVLVDWLARQAPGDVPSAGDSGDTEWPREVCLSVVLRYGTCATDFVPLPGEACRSAEEARTASRRADDFSLALEFKENRPPQLEEHAIRLLGRLLRALRVRPSEAEGAGVSDLRSLVTAVPDAFSSGVDPSTVSLSDLEEEAGASLPRDENDQPVLPVAPGEETTALRALETAWGRDTRRPLLKTGHDPKTNPLEAGRGTNGLCQPVPEGDDGVVLGTLCLSVEPNGEGGLRPATEDRRIDEDAVEVTTDDRPHLLSTRVLQETGLFDRVARGEDEEEPDPLSVEEVAKTLPTLPFVTADLVDPARLADVDASAEEVAVRIRFHLNTHETVTTQDNAYDVGEDFNVQVFSERSDPMTDYLYLTKESVQDRARLGRNVYVLFLRKTSIQNRPHLRLRFDLSEMTINRRAGNGDETRGEVSETVSGTEWIEERPVKWLGHDGTQYVTVFASRSPAGGDLSGGQHAPRVTGLQGTPVSEQSPEENDLLGLEADDEGTKAWRPIPASELDFAPADHRHALGDLSDVNVSDAGANDVLTWQDGTWVPASGGRDFDPSSLAADYVQTNPETEEPYTIVAAGEVAADSTMRSAYGGLQATVLQDDNGLYRLEFEGYQNPRADGNSVSYVVNGTPIPTELVEGGGGGGRLGATFSMVRFEAEGIVVQSIEQALDVAEGEVARQVASAAFMVEISHLDPEPA